MKENTKREQARLRKQKQRDKERDIGERDIDSVTMVPASYVQGVTDKFKSLPEHPRYLTLSDGQVLDRLDQPEGHTTGDFIQTMQRCNESSYNYKPKKV